MTGNVVVFSRQARQNLRAIEQYIARKASPREAEEYVSRIVSRCEKIAIAPHQGERLDDLRPGLRRTGMEGRVSALFTFVGYTVTILSIAYGGRQYESDVRKPYPHPRSP
jgi:plasmid stabilization system protein ParE